MRIIAVRIFLVILFLFMVIVGYTIWDNNRFILVEEEISIVDFPEQLEELRILQISDLHEKQFGQNQKGLIDAINAADYDVIVFTGDMLDDKDRTDYDSFYTLIEGIENKEHALFVRGNTDPDNYQIKETVEKSAFIQGMEERGVYLLESIHSLSINGGNIHFVDFELSIIDDPQFIGQVEGIERPEYIHDEQYLSYKEQLWQEVSAIDYLGENDIVIALNHYPIVDARVDHITRAPALVWRDYDLILAGHYHGGQIRLPFVGALFVPEAWYEPSSFFPPQDRVKGVWEYAGAKQYVSAGLGSSSAIPFMKFRLFNTPEINLLILSE